MSSLAIVAAAATLGQVPSTAKTPAPQTIGGTQTIDFITVKASSPGLPLRYGNVIAGSERVEAGGKALKPEADYAIDYQDGVVYLRTAVRAGETITVVYRYNEKPDPNAPKAGKGLAGFKFDLVPGGLSFMTGLGVAERSADGSVRTANTFGLNNSFKLGQAGTLTGVFLTGERSAARNEAGMRMRAEAGGNADTAEGKSQLIVQSLKSKALGGDVSVDYQDVSKNFAGFNSLTDSGFDANRVNQLRNERGMNRLGWNANNLKLGTLGFSSSYRKVSDDSGTIDWRSYGVNTNGLKLDYSSQFVGNTFNRFKDIAEGDREQLMREKGLRRENWAGELANKVGKLSFTSTKIEDVIQGQGVNRTEFGLDSSLGKLSFGRQNVAAGFNRSASLLADEKGRYGLEAGLSRQWMSLNSGVFGKGSNFTFSDRSLRSSSGDFRSTEAGLKGKTWSLAQSTSTTDSGFNRFNGMNDAEKDQNIGQIARMYGPGAAARPEDRHFLGLSAGLNRSYTELNAQPFKGWNFDFSNLNLQGKSDSGTVQSVGLKRDKFEVNWRRQKLGEQFNEFNNLMSFEKMKLGNVAGLDRNDFGMKVTFGGAKQFAFSSTNADANGKGFDRSSVEFRDKRIEVKLNSREVDAGLNGFNNLADGEKDTLLALQGYRQRDTSVKWEVLSNLRMEFFDQTSKSDFLKLDESMRNANISWAPNAKTSVNYVRNERARASDTSTLFSEIVERISLSRDLGKYGRVAFLDEKVDFGGTQTQGLDSRKQYVAFETKLNARTDLRTAQTRTDFQDGTRENISENTVSTAVNKRLHVSVTDRNVDRDGEDRDETHRNYGFKVDLGKGMQFSYGYARQLLGETAGQLNTTIGLGTNNPQSPDQVGGIQGGEFQGVRIGGGYGVNQWDQTGRTQAFSNFNFSTVKPISLGMFRDVTLNLGMDQASDNRNFLRENRLAAFNGKIGNNTLGYRYVSQMHQSGTRGIDRIFQFNTDTSDKRWWTAAVFYKVRTLPWNDQVMVRNYNFSVRPATGFELVHRLETNPEIARGDVILGSLPQAARSNKWELNWKKSASTTVGMNWQELVNDQTNARARTAGVSLNLFENSGSPLRLFYGLEQSDGNVLLNTRHRYSIQFDQKAGPNQALSLFLGNLSYQHQIQNGFDRNNWTMRLNYQLKF